MSNLLQNFQINLRTCIKFSNNFVRSRLTYAFQSWNLTAFQLERIDSTYRRFLRRMVRNGLKFLDEDGGDYRMLIDNIRQHRFCGTSDVSSFLRQQQRNYMAHVMRMGIDRSTKLLTFNTDKYFKLGRPAKSLLDQLTETSNMTIDAFCSSALLKEGDS